MRIGLCSAAGVLIAPLMLSAGVIYVTNTNDSGAGSFRQAVADAAPGDTIDLSQVSGVIALTSGEILLSKDLQIVGPGADKLALDGSGNSRIVRVDDSQPAQVRSVTISGLAFQNGRVTGENGGAILNLEFLAMSHCAVSGSTAVSSSGGGNGGGIHNLGTLRIDNSAIIGNRAAAASGTTGSGNGGGVCNSTDGTGAYRGIATLVNCTISGNAAEANPHPAGSAESVNSDKRGFGGGVFNDSNLTVITAADPATKQSCLGEANLLYCTVTDNTAAFGGGIANYVCFLAAEVIEDSKAAGDVSLENTAVTGNQSTYVPTDADLDDIVGPVRANHSLVTHISGMAVGEENMTGVQAGLGALAGNGGPTMTHAPLPNSPLVGAGEPIPNVAFDQTGGPREIGNPDIGAYEMPLDVYEISAGQQAHILDADGDRVDFRMDGQGTCYLYAIDGADPIELAVKGSSSRSALTISTSGHTSIRGVNVEGSIGTIDAPRVDLDGDVIIIGFARSLAFADAHGPSRIVIGSTAEYLEEAAERTGTDIQLDRVTDFDLVCERKIANLEAGNWISGADRKCSIQASQIGTVRATGWLDGVDIISEADIGSIRAGGMRSCQVMAGMKRGLVGVPAVAGDFSTQARIGEVLVDGRRRDRNGYSTIDIDISARFIDSVKLAFVDTDNDGTVFGAAAKAIKSLSYQEKTGRRWQWKRYQHLAGPGIPVRSGDFLAAVFGTRSKQIEGSPEDTQNDMADTIDGMPFSFAVTDDSRGGLILSSGVASWNLKWLFQDAFANNCKFTIIPGDVVSGGDMISSCVMASYQYGQLLGSWNTWYTQLGSNLYCTRGNHETYFIGSPYCWTSSIGRSMPQNGPTRNYYGLSEEGFTYTFSYGNTYFVCIDQYRALSEFDGGVLPSPAWETPSFYCLDNCQWTDNGQPKSGNWLRAKLDYYLSNPSLKHCFAFGHCPLFTSVTRTDFINNDHQLERDQFIGLINGIAEVYFTGHDHLYDHCIIKNTTAPPNSTGIDALHHILVGTAGADLDWDAVTPADDGYVRDPSRQYLHDTHHMGYNLVTVDGQSVTIRLRAFSVKKAPYMWEFDEITGFDQDLNTWSYTTGK